MFYAAPNGAGCVLSHRSYKDLAPTGPTMASPESRQEAESRPTAAGFGYCLLACSKRLLPREALSLRESSEAAAGRRV